MARFTDVDVFVAVANAASFRQAANDLGVTKSTVSRAIRRLEAHLGATLIVRDQQALRLTEAGSTYYRFAEAAYASLAEGERRVAVLAGRVTGTIRVSAPPALGQALISRLCAEFVGEHDEVSIDLVLTDRLVSLTSEKFDLVVRAGPELADSGLKVRRLGKAPMVAVAAPEVASSLAHGEPVNMIEFAYPGREEGQLPGAPVMMSSRLRVDDYQVLRESVLAGYGVGVLSETLVREDIAAGRLARVLGDWQLPTASYWALFPGSGPIPAKVRALLEHLVEGFAVSEVRGSV